MLSISEPSDVSEVSDVSDELSDVSEVSDVSEELSDMLTLPVEFSSVETTELLTVELFLLLGGGVIPPRT